jgi:hypothetical protein
MTQETITLTRTKGEFLNTLKGLWGAAHLKGLDLSSKIAANAEIIKSELEDLLYVHPSEEFALVAKEISKLERMKEDGWEAKIAELEESNKDVIDARTQQINDMKAGLEVETELELKVIPKNLLTDEVSANILMALKDIVQD